MNEKKRNPECALDRLPGDKLQGVIVCTEYECARCGWNVNVERARKWYIQRFGLTKGKDGLSRLIIKKGAIQNDSRKKDL